MHDPQFDDRGNELADLRAALLARWRPADAAEAHLVEELVFAAWRQMRLRAVEDAVLARAERGEEPGPGLPSLATLIRYRARIDRDVDRAMDALIELRRRRAKIADPLRLRWLAERIEQAQAIAAAFPPDAPTAEVGTNEPTPTAVEPASKDCTNEFDIGTNEPNPANCTNELPPGMNEPCLMRLWQKGEAPTPCRGWVRGGWRSERTQGLSPFASMIPPRILISPNG